MNDTAYHHCNRAASGCGIGCMDRDGAAAYFGAMIRSVLTVLAAVALMLVSLTTNASATPMTTPTTGGTEHIPCMSMSSGHDVIVAPCTGMGDPACAFACAGKSQPPVPARLDGPLAFGAIVFLPAPAANLAGHRPGQLERPPRSRQA